MFVPHAILHMVLVWLQPTLSLSPPHFHAHRRLCSTHAFAPAVLPASNARLPISTCWRGVLILQDPTDCPKDPTSSTMSSPLYAACFYRDLGSHLTASHGLLAQRTKVREDGDNSGRSSRPMGGWSGDWPHRVCSREQGTGVGVAEAARRWREGM